MNDGCFVVALVGVMFALATAIIFIDQGEIVMLRGQLRDLQVECGQAHYDTKTGAFIMDKK